MIAAAWCAGGMPSPARAAIGNAVGYAPHPASVHDFDVWGGGNKGGRTVLFGRIDNAQDISRSLDLSDDIPAAALYDAALRRWGEDTDHRLVGHYCAITVTGPRGLRLVRSPWTAPPLHFFTSREIVAASPLLGAIFAAGAPRNIDWTYLADQLAFDHHDCEPVGWYEGIGRVPLGSRVIIDGADWKLDRYYDPLAVEPVELASDEAYVERGLELLDEAAGACVAGLKNPAIMLSGGLDSPLAALAVSKHLPEDQRLPSFTFGPHPDWDGWEPESGFGEEREMVRRFAAMHPRLEPHFPEERGGHDYALRELLARTEVPTANIANTGIFHPLFEAAKAQGCDAMLTALHGNFTISLDGDWAAPEALRKGRLARLVKLAAAEEPEHALPRRILSMAVLPHLPSRLQRAIRKRVHPERFGDIPLSSLLSAEAGAKWRKKSDARGSVSSFESPPIPASREQAIRAMWASADSGEDLDLGMERLYGMAHRDVTAYRPLFEFCHGLPTDQLRRPGKDRYLARRMARGLMPEAQRTEVRQGRHNVDWHARLSARRTELLAQAEAMRAHPQLSAILDIDRMQELLRDWPAKTPRDPRKRLPREVGLTRAFTTAIFVSHTEKRNDF